jgi:large subunit ribosomal protein L24
MKIKKGDKVKVMVGKDKGKEAVIERVYSAKNKVLLPKVNIFKKHIKKSEKMPQGGLVEVERPLDVSKVMLMCPKCNQPARTGYVIKNEKKSRMCKRCKSII